MTGGIIEESRAGEDSLAGRAGRAFAAYRDGDETRMAELVRMLTPILWHTARSMRLDSQTAEDVVQSVWLVLVRKADSITEPLALLQWMLVTTKREAWRVSRIQARTRPEDFDGPGAPDSDSGEAVEDEVLRGDTDAKLWRHIEALPERCRALLRVIAFADRPDYAELAKALGMPQGSIGPTRGRCLAKLRLALSNDPAWEAR
ncbi:sigma-70 family RNA polymerase sigma factor [Microlunatus panaciterrae]|uniref:RNA polymerase sigma factor (Sigma-70 family) n=1 Tax=Microlunatus panaciterrae TaxID=400768 RepID=A0ABS2RL06_9ACTN|nr:sigma-70 family RNA polymerase sigma factor [Microlunatus panaciterrae]MBM7799682.1 RNA polymerase sigma factor (sigma-70 family) [Microlunatus panaciterrae]